MDKPLPDCSTLLSVHAAKFHVGALIDKFDAVGRTDAVAHAARRRVIHL